MSVDIWLAFVAACLFLLMIPGPTVLIVLSYALQQARSVAWISAGAVVTGHLVAMCVVALSAAMLSRLLDFPLAALQWVGVVFITYLGLRIFRSRPISRVETLVPKQTSRASIFLHIAAITVLNPCSVGFFAAVIPQFLPVENAQPRAFGILAATFICLAGLNALGFAMLAGWLRPLIRRPESQIWLNRFAGALLVAIAGLTAVSRMA